MIVQARDLTTAFPVVPERHDQHRVLVYSPTVGRGGVHRVVETLTQALDDCAPRENWDFTVLGQTYDEIGEEVHWPERWPFHQIDPGAVIPAHPMQFQWLFHRQQTFYEHLARFAPDYDLIYCPSPWWTLRVNHWGIKTPFIATVPDFAFDHIDMGLLAYNFRYVSQLMPKRLDMTIFPSDFQRNWGESRYGFQKTRTIQHSGDFISPQFQVSKAEASRVKHKYHLPQNYVLAFHPMNHKGIMTVLDAMERLDFRPPLVIAGIGTEHLLDNEPANEQAVHIRNYFKMNRLIPRHFVKVLGRVPEADIAGLYMNATCAVCASESEGDLAGTIWEAMMTHCPLIYSDLPVFLDRLGTDNQYGLQIPVKDGQGLATAISQIRKDADGAKRRADAAYAYATSRTKADVAREYLNTFEEVIAAHRSV